jgi:hypothetical protein
MKIKKNDLINLIRESLKSAHFGTRDPAGKLSFAPDLKDMESVYGKNIGGKVSKQKLEEFFKDAIVPFNVILIPDDAYRTLQNIITGDGSAFEQVELNFFEKALTSITSMFRGKYDDLAAIRSKIDPNAYNIMIERKDEDYGAFLFDLTWVAHDLIGHGINLSGVGDYGMLVSGLGALFNAVFHLPVPSKFQSGTGFDQNLKIGDNRVFSDVADNTVISAIKADLERENFTPGVAEFDLAASVLGYYFIKGKFPSIIYDLAAEGTLDINKINQYESDFKKMVESLKGKVGMFRFGDNMKYLEI